MKKSREKNLAPQQRKEKFESGNDLVFYDNYPFEALNAPKGEIICVAVHWDQPQSMESTGTAYSFLPGLDDLPLKCDAVSFKPIERGGAMILHVEKSDQNYPHHIKAYSEILPFITDQASDEIKEKFRDVLNPGNQV